MASVHKETTLPASPEAVWAVVRDVGAVHTRLAPGFVVDTVMEDGARTVTFANGLVAREVIVEVDEARRRLAYSARSERLSHHHASFQVFPDQEGARLVDRRHAAARGGGDRRGDDDRRPRGDWQGVSAGRSRRLRSPRGSHGPAA